MPHFKGKLMVFQPHLTGAYILYSPCDLQTAVGIIEAHPNKKIKTKKLGNGDCVPYQLGAGSSMATSRKSCKVVSKGPRAASGGGSKVTKATKSDLPQLVQDDIKHGSAIFTLVCSHTSNCCSSILTMFNLV